MPGDALVFGGGVLHHTHVAATMTRDRTSLELRFFPPEARLAPARRSLPVPALTRRPADDPDPFAHAAEPPDVLVVAKLWPPMMESLRGAFRVHDRIHQTDPTAFAAVAPRIRAISASGESKVPRELIAQLPALEIISVFGVGYDGVDVAAARERGIAVTNTPDVLNDEVADLAIGLCSPSRAAFRRPTATCARASGRTGRCRWRARSAARGSASSASAASATRSPSAPRRSA
jgi:hypothetical protein